MKQITMGFTLIELMLVMAVLVILLAVGVPNYQQFRNDNELSGAAFTLYSDIQLAKTEAVKRNNNNIRLYFFDTAGTEWCYRITDRSVSECNSCSAVCDIGGDGITRGNDQQNYPHTALTTSFNSGNNIQVSSRRSGLQLSDPADHINLALAGKEVTVGLSRMGAVHICSASGSSLPGVEPCS